MGLLVTLGIYAVIALGAIGAVWGFIHSHDNGIRNEQIAKDTVILEKVKKERDASREQEQQREAETAQCVAKANEQSKAVNDLDRRGQAAIAASRRAMADAQAKAAASAGEVAKLRAIVAAAPATDQTCQETLAKTDAILRSMIKARK